MESQFFDRDSEVDILQRRLPHWEQAGTWAFITFRTHDSMPRSVVEEWIDNRDRSAKQQAAGSVDKQNQSDLDRFSSHWHEQLDQCHGACELRNYELAQVVANALLHFDSDRYLMSDFVIMPNHVHLLAAFSAPDGMLKQCQSWKRFTAKQINQILKRSGRFWQQDAFDHLVRSEKQFDYFRNYILENPAKANLRSGEYIHYSTA